MFKKFVLGLLLLSAAVSTLAQNVGFESGDMTGWTKSGTDVTTSTVVTNVTYGGGKYWTIKPYGTYMGLLYPSGSVTFDNATSSLGLTSAENTAIRQFMTANASGGSPNPTNASWIKKTVSLQAGITYTYAWNYLSTDYTPFNDGSMISVVHSTNASIIPTLNNLQQRYGLLGFTNPGSGNYSTDSYGSTGWQVAVFTVPESGNYVLGFATFNLGDTWLSPMLFIDELQGVTELNGQSFGPIAPNAGSSAPAAPTEPSYSSDITQTQTASMNAALSRRNALSLGNQIYIDEKAGSTNNKVTISQSSNFNSIKGLNVDTYATLNGSNNDITIRQGEPNNTTGKNLLEFSLIGNSNIIEINQARTITTGLADGTDSNGHYAKVNITGSTNTLRTQQTNAGTGPHYMEVDLTGNNNSLLLKQNGDNTKKIFSIVNGSYNSLDISQTGSGTHYLDITLTGNNNNATIIQKDSGTHKATINLSNNGGGNNLTLTQQGSSNQVYSISQQCANLNGCSVIVTQGPAGP